MELLRSESTEWADIAATYVEACKRFGPDNSELSTLENTSDQIKLTQLFLDVAVELGKKRGLPPQSGETFKLLDEAMDCAKSITYAFPIPSAAEADTVQSVRRAFRMAWSANPGDLFHDARNLGRMVVSSSDLEYGVGQYLRSEFKDSRIDRFLVRALADMELSAFLSLEITPGILTPESNLEMARQGVVAQWLRPVLDGLAIAIAVCSVLVAIKIYFPATPDWLAIGGFVLVAGGYLVFAAVSLVGLVTNGPKIAASRKRVLGTILAASEFYGEFHARGTISLGHYRKRLEEARQKGIVWPQSLWALVDDMDRRGVSFF